MNGLDLSEMLFTMYGMPMISEKFSEYKHKITAGLVGDGSECYGFDDELSRDHDWGPSFCLWLNKDDYNDIGASLQAEYDKLPKALRGYGPRKVSPWGENRVGVLETSSFYRGYIGLDRPPTSLTEWLRIPETALSACTNGKVFHDPPGEFMRIRNILIQFYPEDVRLKKIAARCMTIAHYGQYNFARCVKRREYYAARHAESEFCSAVISLVFLLNRKYLLFFKWMHRAVKDLPVLGEFTHIKILELINTVDYKKKNFLIEMICARIIQELNEQGLSDSPNDFLLDHGPVIQQKIQDPELKRMSVLFG